MKRFLFLTVAVFFACFNAHGQAALVFDAFTSQLLENNQAQTMVKYALMLKDSATQIEQFITMIEQTGKQIDMSMQNLANLKDIHKSGKNDGGSNRKNFYLTLNRRTAKPCR